MPGLSIAITAFDITRRAFNSFNQRTDQATARVRAFSAATRTASASMNVHNAAAMRTAEVNRRVGISFGNLLKLMFQFGIALAIINFPSRVAAGIGEAVTLTAEWEKELRLVNTILGLSDKNLDKFSMAAGRMNVELGGGVETLQAMFDAAQQLVGIDLSEPIRAEFRGLGAEAQAVFDITKQARIAALASGASVNDVSDALGRMISLLGFQPGAADELSDLLFQVQKVSDLRVGDLSQGIGELLPLVDMLGQGDASKAFEQLREAMAMVGTFSQALGPAQALTGFRNFTTALIGTGREQKQTRDALKSLGVNFTLADAAANGLGDTFKELFKLAPEGEIISKFVSVNPESVALLGESEFRLQKSAEILRSLFPNIRASRAVFVGLTRNGALFTETLEKMGLAAGATQAAFEQMNVTMDFARGVAGAAANEIRKSFAFEIIPSITKGLNLFGKFISRILDNRTFQNANLPQKVRIFLNSFTDQFENWFNTGGRDKIASVASMFGQTMAEVVAALLGRDNANIYLKAGGEAASSFAKGFIQNLIGGGKGGVAGDASGFLSSFTGRGIAGFLGARALGRGRIFSAGAGALVGGVSGALPGGGATQALFDALTFGLIGRSLFGGAAGRLGGFLSGRPGQVPAQSVLSVRQMNAGGTFTGATRGQMFRSAGVRGTAAFAGRAVLGGASAGARGLGGGIGRGLIGAARFAGFGLGPGVGAAVLAASFAIPALLSLFGNRNRENERQRILSISPSPGIGGGPGLAGTVVQTFIESIVIEIENNTSDSGEQLADTISRRLRDISVSPQSFSTERSLVR